MNHRTSVLLLMGLACGCRPLPGKPAMEAAEERETPATQLTTGRLGEDLDPEISPDGKLLYYASSAHGDPFDLFVREVGSLTSTRIAATPGNKRFPRLNPVDARYLAFCTDGRGEWEIALLDLASSPTRIEYISEPGASSLHPSWSPDGRRIVYCASEASADRWILKIWDASSRKTHLLEDVDGLLPEWSPCDNRIVFQRMRHRDGWYSGLWTVEFDGTSARNLTRVFADDEWACINPSWSSDGRRIVFTTVGKSRARAGVLDRGDDLWVVNADGSHSTRLTTSPAADWMPAWSGDGTIYFVSDRSGANRLWSLKPKLPGPGETGF